jgi:hypothetical protein
VRCRVRRQHAGAATAATAPGTATSTPAPARSMSRSLVRTESAGFSVAARRDRSTAEPQVRVCPQRHRRVAVPERALHRHDVAALCDQAGREEVAQVVQLRRPDLHVAAVGTRRTCRETVRVLRRSPCRQPAGRGLAQPQTSERAHRDERAEVRLGPSRFCSAHRPWPRARRNSFTKARLAGRRRRCRRALRSDHPR